MDETSFTIIFWINESEIYTATWRSMCCQLLSLSRLNISAKRYISWRQIWNISLTVVIYWICLRFTNIEIKYLRMMGICIPKYTAERWNYFVLQYWEDIFFRFVSALKLVCFPDFWGFKYTYLCLQIRLHLYCF